MKDTDNKRSRSDKKYRLIKRSVSRYGFLEKALKELKKEKIKQFNALDVACRTRALNSYGVASLLKFTRGVKNIGNSLYEFDGKRIRVMEG